MESRMKHRFAIALALLVAGLGVARAQPGLKEAFEGKFLIGGTLNPSHFAPEAAAHTGLITTQFNSISPENVMKWGPIHPRPGRYRFAPADRYVDFGERHGMFIVGHCLIWHQQTPDWVFEDANGAPLDREALLERMREHIHTVVGRYKGRVHGWDVVNEAVADDGTMRDTPWRQIIGDDYVLKAFEFAHEADPDAELYYNDFGIENRAKRAGAMRLLRELQVAGARLDGVGIQQHVNFRWPRAELIDESIAEYGALGIKVMITELDIDMLPGAQKANEVVAELHMEADAEVDPALDPYRDGLPAEMEQRMADRYAELFAIYLKHADLIDRVTFWGVTDEGSWMNNFPIRGRTAYPLLFNRGGTPKPAYNAVLEVASTDPSAAASRTKPRSAIATPRSDPNSAIAHQQLLAKRTQGRIDVYFTGDSIMRRWGATDYPQYLAHWNESFHGWNAANFAWGGDGTQHILWRLENGELDGVNPKVIVLQGGTNNIGGTDLTSDTQALAEDVADGIWALLEACRARVPDATIILMAIFPRNDNPTANPVIEAVNARIAGFADGETIRFLNINDKLADETGRLREGMAMFDRLHLDLKGYQTWANALHPLLTNLLGPPAKEDHAPPPTGDPSATN